MLPVAVTLILFVTTSETNGNDGVLKDRQNRQRKSLAYPSFKCIKKVDKAFLTFVEAFKVNYLRITRNIYRLKDIFVSVFLSSFIL